MNRYWIPEHVHVCILKDIVWLDERTNKYLIIDGAAASILGQIVHGWPRAEDPEKARQFTEEQREALIGKLLAKGLISKSLGNGKRYSEPLDQVRSDPPEIGYSKGAPLSFRLVIRFALAFAWAKISLRVAGLRRTLAWIERRKANVVADESMDVAAVGQMVGAFRRLRVFFYSPKRNCLLDSLVLTHFLFRSRVVPTVVFGVAVRPFHAHCWDRWKGIVLNGGADVADLHKCIREI